MAAMIFAAIASRSAIALVCSFNTAPALGFGNYDVFSATSRTTSQSISVSCLVPTTMTVSIGASSTSGSIANRQMAQAAGSGRLAYNIYRDSGFTQLWGDGTAGTTPLTLTVVLNTSFTVYGKVDAGQNVPAGTYADTVVITINP